MSHKIVITEIRAHPDGVTQPVETRVFEQTVENFNLAQFVCAINKAPRRRKAKSDKNA